MDIRKLESAWQLTLVAADRPFLFASVAGTLSSFGMNILKAEAFSNRRGLVLDTFTFDDPLRTLDLNPTEAGRLRATTERVLAGKTDVRELLRNRPKPVLPSRKARIPATVSFDSDASRTATLVEIVAEDRPGLLYDLASAISSNGGNIEVVLIDTQAHKAIDVFYVTAEGKKLGPEKRQLRRRAAQSLPAGVGAGGGLGKLEHTLLCYSISGPILYVASHHLPGRRNRETRQGGRGCQRRLSEQVDFGSDPRKDRHHLAATRSGSGRLVARLPFGRRTPEGPKGDNRRERF